MAPHDELRDVSGDQDLEEITTLGELAEAFNRLRQRRSYSDLARAAERQPRRHGRQPALPRATLSDLLNGRSAPNRDTVITFLMACDLPPQDLQPWLAAWERSTTSHLRRPSGAVRVRESRARRLGVHASIRVGPRTDDLPAYVGRDFDDELRDAIRDAADEGGMVLLNGGSSVGKTRAMYEAVRAVLPEWWLIKPDDVKTLNALAETPTARTVVWLDELQRYLSRPGRSEFFAAASVRRLLTSGTVVVATLWPDVYFERMTPDDRDGPFVDDREILSLAHVIDVPSAFSAGELRRAEALVSDARIRVALQSTDAGVTQVLAAGPNLVRWWRNAPAEQCYGQAVITAALDARRVGAEAPLTREYLAAAGPFYLSSAQRATAPQTWLDDALRYAITSQHGATSCLVPAAAGMGKIAGYRVADYLFQEGLAIRRSIPLVDSVWKALLDHHAAADSGQLAIGAYRRGRRVEGLLFDYRLFQAGGDQFFGSDRLVDNLVSAGLVDEALEVLRVQDQTEEGSYGELDRLLAAHDRVDELAARSAAGNRYTTKVLSQVLARKGDIDGAARLLRSLADSGDWFDIDELNDFLAEHGRHDELAQRAGAGDAAAARRIAESLIASGRIEDAIDLLRPHVVNGHGNYHQWASPWARDWIAGELARQGRIDEVADLLKPLAERGDWEAHAGLLTVYLDNGRTGRAIALLRQSAETVGPFQSWSRHRLLGVLAEHGHLDEAMAMADPADGLAATTIARHLAENGRRDEAIHLLRSHLLTPEEAVRPSEPPLPTSLTARPGGPAMQEYDPAEDGFIVADLLGLLREAGRTDEAFELLRARADAGSTYAAGRWAEFLAEEGQPDAAIAVLRTYTVTDNVSARFCDLLLKQGAVNQLTLLAELGNSVAGDCLVRLREQRGDIEWLPQRAEADVSARLSLVELLAENRRIDDLLEWAERDHYAGYRVAPLLIEDGRVEEAIEVVRRHYDGGQQLNFSIILVNLLADLERTEELDAEVSAGTIGAVEARDWLRNGKTGPRMENWSPE